MIILIFTSTKAVQAIVCYQYKLQGELSGAREGSTAAERLAGQLRGWLGGALHGRELVTPEQVAELRCCPKVTIVKLEWRTVVRTRTSLGHDVHCDAGDSRGDRHHVIVSPRSLPHPNYVEQVDSDVGLHAKKNVIGGRHDGKVKGLQFTAFDGHAMLQSTARHSEMSSSLQHASKGVCKLSDDVALVALKLEEPHAGGSAGAPWWWLFCTVVIRSKYSLEQNTRGVSSAAGE
ncbi:hypothetical protein B566_EDAN008676 [Ephemera danica]|nr:hypothetical protein B566_EDAN008676 [Ephemera danica]